MRFDALYLKAFGPFTDRELDLSRGRDGVHVLYGPNEAGKSSALRAVRALLYGVPERTGDTFRHDSRALRVGARIRPRDGAAFLCFRRKGRKQTLLDGDGRPLDEAVLAALLQGVDEPRFGMLFGIDHASLVAGGEELLAERGREAEALFGSALGGQVVHRALAELDREAQELFVPKGQRPLLNARLKELEQVRREEREAALSPREWNEARGARDGARAALAQAEEALREAQTRRATLERLRRTLPGVARVADLERRIAELGDVPALADDFAERHRDAVEGLRAAGQALALAEQQQTRLQQQIQGLVVSRQLLEAADAVDDLLARLAQRRKALQERPGLEADLQRVSADAERHRRVLGFCGEREALEAQLAHRARTHVLGRQHGVRAQQVREREQQLAARESRAQRCRQQLETQPVPADASPLREAVRAARALGDVDGQVATLSRRSAAAERECRAGLSALGRWSGEPGQLLALALPEPGGVRAFQDEFQEQAGEERRLRDALRAGEERLRQARADLRALELAGAVPTDAELSAARETRARGWALVRDAWLRGSGDPQAIADYTGGDGSGEALARAFEAAASAADDVADRLRREAGRVHDWAGLTARCDAQALEIADLERSLEACARGREALEARWQALWAACGVTAGSVAEMDDWLSATLRLREQVRTWQSVQGDLDAMRERRAAARGRVIAAGMSLGVAASGDDALEPVLAQAEACLQSVADEALRRQALVEESTRLAEESAEIAAQLEQARSERAAWQQAWGALARELSLEREPGVEELSERFERLQELAGLMDRQAELTARMVTLDRADEAFRADVQALCGQVAPELSTLDPDAAVARLRALLREQQGTWERLQTLRKQSAACSEEGAQAQERITSARQSLAGLCTEAGVDDEDQLEAVEQRHGERRRLLEDLQRTRDELLAQGDGASVAALAEAAAKVDPDSVAGELQQLERSIAQSLEPARRERSEACFGAERDFEQMRGGADAAELESRAQQLVAEIRDGVERYIRVRLAAQVLREQIDRFSRANRDPILAAAGDYFRTLTGGGFVCVETDFDAADEPVLSAVRDGGERLDVAALSTGTRDQLYLALRLATLDHYLERVEPLPLVVDDILVQFDDARTRATLRALARFSRRTQVLLFTHHARVADDARAMAGEGGGVFVHEL